jgi:trans-aconitate methyltransferase
MDVGCGTAENLRAIEARFPRARLVGGEASLHALMQGQRKCKAQLLQMDVRAILYIDAFDVLGAFDVLEHVGGREERNKLNTRLFLSKTS